MSVPLRVQIERLEGERDYWKAAYQDLERDWKLWRFGR